MQGDIEVEFTSCGDTPITGVNHSFLLSDAPMSEETYTNLYPEREVKKNERERV